MITSIPDSINWDKLPVVMKGASVTDAKISVDELCPNQGQIKEKIRNEIHSQFYFWSNNKDKNQFYIYFLS